ncbi:MAG: DUF3450 domain-containing protein [Myxococcota bacterium]
MLERAIQTGLALCSALALIPSVAGAQDAAAPPAPPASAEKLGRAMQNQLETDADARAAQQRIEAIDDETLKMLSEYRRALADAESYATYARQLESQVRAQNEEMASIDRQLAEVETTSREVLPLMEQMLGTLKQFVDLDVPFLLAERRKRVAMLEAMMPRADVTLSEKYRRILEAYQIELDYGRTLEAYEAELGEGEDARTVLFLRVGRVALLYQTLDAEETGFWDTESRSWLVDDAYKHDFQEAVTVAKKLRAPEMLRVPLPAPKQAKS